MTPKIVNNSSGKFRAKDIIKVHRFLTSHPPDKHPKYIVREIIVECKKGNKKNRWSGYADWNAGKYWVRFSRDFGPYVERTEGRHYAPCDKIEYLVAAMAHEYAHIHYGAEAHVLVHHYENEMVHKWQEKNPLHGIRKFIPRLLQGYFAMAWRKVF